jgi:hypothetical protein
MQGSLKENSLNLGKRTPSLWGRIYLVPKILKIRKAAEKTSAKVSPDLDDSTLH